MSLFLETTCPQFDMENSGKSCVYYYYYYYYYYSFFQVMKEHLNIHTLIQIAAFSCLPSKPGTRSSPEDGDHSSSTINLSTENPGKSCSFYYTISSSALQTLKDCTPIHSLVIQLTWWRRLPYNRLRQRLRLRQRSSRQQHQPRRPKPQVMKLACYNLALYPETVLLSLPQVTSPVNYRRLRL